jgi:hypothetical protein
MIILAPQRTFIYSEGSLVPMITEMTLLLVLLVALIALISALFAWAVRVWAKASPLVRQGDALMTRFVGKDGEIKPPSMEEVGALTLLQLAPKVIDSVADAVNRGLGKLFRDGDAKPGLLKKAKEAVAPAPIIPTEAVIVPAEVPK